MKAPRLKATSHVVHLGRRINFKDVILGFLTRENLIDQDKGVLVLDSEKCVIATWSLSSVLHRGTRRSVYILYRKQVKNPTITSNGISHLPGWPDVSFLLRTSRGRKSGQKNKINGVFLPDCLIQFQCFCTETEKGIIQKKQN